MGLGAYQDEQSLRRDGLRASGEGIFQDQAFEPSLPAAVHDPGVQASMNVLGRLDLFYQVVGHAGG